MDPSSGGSIGSDQCGTSGYNPVALTSLSLPLGHTGTLEYRWLQSTTSRTTGFGVISGATLSGYDPGVITQTTWYKRQARVTCSADWSTAAESNVVEVSIGSNDQSPPVITCPANIIVNAPSGTCASVATFSLPTYTDNCSLTGPLSGNLSFSYTGGVQTWTVPVGVTYVEIQAWGASGGAGGSSNNPGGQGGYATGRLNVTAGQVLQIYVGGQGSSFNDWDVALSGGYNGGGSGGYDTSPGVQNGGSGGGATDVRISGTKMIVAGGGGGGSNSGNGGDGGGLTGNAGDYYGVSHGGGGGTQSGGGSAYTGFGATAGSLGQGGNGASGNFYGSGGGGGGYYGGGGGSAGAYHGSGWGAGGGGGSSYIGGVSCGSTSTGGWSGNGYLTLSYDINLSSLVSGQASCTSFPVGTTTNVYTVSDNAGNSSTCSFTVKVNDTTAPSLPDPADVTLYTDTDNVACPASNSVSPGASQSVPVATGGAAFNYTVNGVTRSGPTGYTDQCFSGANLKLYLWAVNLNKTGTTSTCSRQIELTWRVYDADGNYAEQKQLITIVDRTKPTFTRPVDGTFTAPDCVYVQQLPAVTGDVTNESDNCQTGLDATFSDGAPTAGVCPGTFTVNRTWSLVDGCGNAATDQVQVITINENTAPTVSSTNSPNDPDIDAYSCGASFTYNAGPSTCFINKTVAKPTWVDACGGTVTRAQSADNGVTLSNFGDFVGANFPVGTTIVTFSATDCQNNTGYCTLSITVNDTQLPTITGCPTNQTATADPGACSRSLNLVIPTAGDNCSVASVTYSTTGVTTLSGAEFPNPLTFNAGLTTVVYRAFDGAGNSRSCTFTVTITDPVPPVAACKNATVQLSSSGTASIAGSALDNGSTDNCPLTFTPVPASFTCANLGANTVTLNVSDGTNTRTCTAVVTVQDITPPTASCRNYTLQLNASGSGTLAAANIDNSSTDACGITTRTLSKTAYTCSDLGASTVTLTLSDASGNTSTCTGTVTVQDITSPTAVCQNVTAALVGNSVTVTAAQVNNNSTDNCGIASMSLSTSSFTCANLGSNNVTLTVTDASGNAGNCAAVVTVIDNTPPVASCRNITVTLTSGTVNITAAQVNNGSTDNCGTPSVSVTPSSFSCGGAGGNTVTLTATDASNNTSTCTATVTVNDVTQPTITTCPSNQTITNCIAPGYTGSVMATDDCGVASITQSPAAGASLGIGHGQSATITYTVTDNGGNTRTCSNTVTVNDQTPPTATCNNLTVTLDPVTNQATVNASQLTGSSTDACGAVTSIVPAWKASPGSCAGAVCLSGGTSFPALRNGGGTYTYSKTSCLATSRNESWFYFHVTSSGSVSMPVSISPSSDIDYACWGPFTSVPDGCANFSTANQVACDYSGANGGTISINSASTGYYILVISNFGNQAGSITLSNNAGSATVGACTSTSGTETSYVYNQTNLGLNTVTVQVTDAAGNSSTCNAVVTVQVNDLVPPVATCQDVSVSLDGSNSASIRERDIDGGSTDNVAVSSYSLSNSSFNCSNIGANVVTLTVSDPAGNTATCNSVVTVNDVTVPIFADPADVTLTTNAAADCPTPASITLTASQSTPVSTANTAFSYTVHGKTQSGPTSYSDNCATGSDLKLYCWDIDEDYTGGANNCSRQIQITWRVYDKNNANYTEQTQLFTINDNTIPVFTRPADITINAAANCTPDLTPANTGDVTNEEDNCANASSITLVSPNDPLSEGIPSDTRHCVTMVLSQNVTFDWSYSTVDLDPTHDLFGYSINGIFTQLSDDVGALNHSGSETIPVSAGAEFCLIQSTIDNRGGSATTVVDRFIANQLITATYVDGANVNLTCPGEFYFDRTWSLTDGCGNAAANQVQRITVRDRTAPVVTTTNNSFDPDIDDYVCGTAYTFDAGPQVCFLSKTIAKPEWSDACMGTLTRTQSATNNVTISNYGSFVSVDFPVGTTTVTFRAQDCPGNTAECSVTVTITDNQAPTLTGCPQNQTWAGDLNSCNKTITLVIPTAGDNCAVTEVTHTLSGATTLVDNEFPNQLDLYYGVTSIVYAAFDAAGNSATCSFTVTVTDPQPPTISCPANATVNADAGVCYHTATGGVFDPVVVDNCPVTPVFSLFGTTSLSGSGSLNGIQFNKGITTVNWSATDLSSSGASCSFTVQVNDIEPPAVPADAGSTVACLAAATAPVIPSATDNCTGTINVELLSVVDDPASLTCEGTRTYTYEYSDDSGNVASDKWVYTYTIEYLDFTMPSGNGSTIACLADTTLPVPPAVNDNCGNAIIPTGPARGNNTSCEGTYTYTWTYTDCEGNSHPWVYIYTIEREDFAVNIPANGGSTVACIADITPPVPPTVNDHCGNEITPSSPVTGGTYTSCEGTRTYTYTYTDCEGNTHPWVYTYTIEREDFTMPADDGSTVSCIASATAPTPPTVTDACGNAITPVGPTMGGNYTSCEGTRTFTWVYTDCEGNSHPWVYTYTIELGELTVPAWGSSTVSCITQFTQPTPPVVTDACGNVLTPTGPNLGINYNGCEGSHTYSWTYTDCKGNTNDWAYTYYIDNNTPPSVTNTSSSYNPDIENYSCGVSYTFPGGQSACIINKSLTVPDWADDCGAVDSSDYVTSNGIVLSRFDDIVFGNFPVGPTVVTFRAFDCAGNIGTCEVTINVNDQQNPTLTGCPTNKLGNADSGTCTKTFNLVIPTASDNCSVASVTYSVTGTTTLSGTEFPNELTFNAGLSTVTYTVYDPAGNTATCSFDVFVIDTQPLSITCPSNTTVSTDAGVCTHTGTAGVFNVTVSDNCPPASQVYTLTGATASTGSNTLDGVTLNKGVTSIRWVVTDQGGVAKTCSFTVTVNDTEMPTVPADVASTVSCPSAMVAPTVPTGTDNCDGTVAGVLVSVVNNPSSLTCEGTRTYTYSYTDASGNAATDFWTYTYTLEREDFSLPADAGSTVACIAQATVPAPPSVTDNCGNALTPAAPVTGGTYTSCEGTRTYTYTYTDCEGNTHDWVYTYTIERNDFNIPANGSSTVACIAQATAPVPPSVNDHCGNALTPSAPVTGGTYTTCEGTRTYTYTYTDCEGNTHDWVYTYTIEREDFAMNMPADGASTVACIADATQPNPPVVNDQCGNAITPAGPTTGGNYSSCTGTRTYTWVYTDCEGNAHNWVYTYTIDRLDFSLPANGASSVSCITDVVTPVPPAVNDNCGNPITPVGPTTGGNYTSCEGTRTYTWVYTDCDGNTHDWVYTYTIDNNTAPTVTSTLTISNPDIEGYTCGSTFTYPAGQSTCIINKSLSHPTWSDDCGSAITTTLSTDNGVALSQVSDVIVGNFPTGTTVIRFTGTDCAGNTGLCTVSVVVQDSQAPTITGCPPSTITTTTDQGQCNKALNPVTPTAGDNCTVASVSYTSTGATQLSGSEFPNQLTFNVGTTVVTYTVSDASGNTTACSYSVTINDNQPITVACPSNQTFGTNTGVCTYTSTGAWVAVVTDNCPTQSLNYTLSGATTATGSNTLSGVVFHKGVTTVTWTAADPGSGTASCSFTITVTDQEAPVVAANGSSTVSCPSAMVAPSVPAAVDNCDGAVSGVLTSTVNTPSFINCEGTRVYTYSYTDAAGNVATWTYTYTLEREDFSMPANQGSTIACISLAFTPPPPSVTDNCGGPIVPTGPVMGGTYTDCEGTRTFTWTYTDCEGNSHPWVFTYTIERNDFMVPANGSSTVACIAQATAPVPPVVTDACGNTLTPTGPVTGGTYTSCEGTRTYTYTYTDCEGNTHPWVYTYTIERQDFAVNMPANGASTVACIANATPPAPPAVNDNCGNPVTPTGPTTGGTFNGCSGTRTYTWVYTDCEGNSHNWVYTYTINRLDFALATPGASTVSCIANATQPAPPVINDNCGSPIIPTGPTIGGTFNGCEGTRTFTWVYTDCDGNSKSWVYTYTIDNNTAPTVSSTFTASNPDIEGYTCGSTFTYPAGQSACIINKSISNPTWVDDCGSAVITALSTDNGVVLSQVSDVVVGNFPTGTTIVRFTGTDCAGNTGICTVAVIVQDGQSPTITGCPPSAIITSIDQGQCNKVLSLVIPTAGDNCTVASVSYTSTGATQLSGSEFPNQLTFNVGNTVVTYTVTDASGNTTACSYAVTVNDNQPISVACPSNQTFGTNTGVCTYTATAPWAAVVTDNCPLYTLNYVLSGVTTGTGANTLTGKVFNKGVTTVRWTATDQGNATASCTFTITVTDQEAPVVAANGSSTVSCPTAMVTPTAPTAVDNCDGAISGVQASIVNTPSPIVCEGTRVYTYTYTDAAGNATTWTYTYTLEREDFNMPANQGLQIACPAQATLPNRPNVNDQCGNPITPTGPVFEGNYNGCEGTITYTWTYTDCEGNTHPWVYTYTIERNDFTVPANGSSTVSCIAQATPPTPPSVNDNCGNALTPTGPVTGGTYTSCEGTRTYTYTYTDCEGNTHPWVYTYTIERENFSMPANGASTVACIASATQPVPPAVNDNCGNPITPVGPTTGGTYAGCEGTRTYTWVYTDCEGNANNWVYTYTIERENFTIPSSGASTVSCISNAVVPTPPAVNDHCGNPITPVGPTTGGTYTSCEGTRTYTWVYTDCEGNTNNWVYTYTIDNNTAPTVSSTLTASNPDIEGYTCGSTFTYPAGQSACIINKSISNPTWTDDCGSTVTTTISTNSSVVLSQVGDVVVGNFPTGTTIVRFTGTDCAGNTGECTISIVIQDGQLPTITGCPPSTITTTTDQGQCNKALNLVIPTAGDNCTVASVNYSSSGATSVSGAEFPNQLTFNVGTTVVTYTVSDASGNTRTCSYSVTVTDNQPVTITCPTSQSFNTNTGVCTYTSVGALTPVVTDNCPIQGLTYTFAGITAGSGSNTLAGVAFNRGLTMVTWKATDAGGSTATCSFFVTVLDREAPSVPADAGTTVNCPSAAVAPVVPTATDNCNGAIAGVLVSVVDNPSPLTCEGTRTYTYSYTDATGNAATDTWVYTYTVNYNTPLVPPASVTVQTACAADAVNPGAPASIQDACGRTVTPVLVGSVNGPNNTACSGTVTWRYRYTACDGTTADWTHTWNYQDNLAPVATLPSAGYSTCFQSETSAFATLLQQTTVTDNCTGIQSLRSLASYQFVPYNDGNNCNDGNMILRFVDECGNGPTILTFTGIKIDNVAPSLVSFPNNITQQICIDNLPVPDPAGVVASDNCDPTVDVTFVSDQLPTTCQGTVTRTYRLTDDCGNTRLVEQYFNVTNDKLAPVMTAGTLLTSYPSVTQGQAAAIAATGIQDDCTPYANLNIQAVVTGTCPATITVIATDQCGHSSQVTYNNICLGDILTIVTPASNAIVNCEDEQNALAAWLNSRGGAQVSSPGVVWTNTPVQFGAVDCVTHSKSATVTFRAQSPYGAFVETSATFTVRDLQLPSVQSIPNQTLTCITQLTGPNTQVVVATDNCDNALSIALFSSTTNNGIGCANSPRTDLRTYSVTDDYCNTVYVTQQITVADNVPPTFTVPANITVNIGPNCSYNSSVSVTGDVTDESDNCSSGLNATFTDVTTQGGGQGIRYTISRTWRLTDNCGNAAAPQVQVISVADNVPPLLTCPANISVAGATIGTSSCAWRAVNATPVSTDNCGVPTVTYSLEGSFVGASTGNKTINGVIFLEGITTVTYTSTDAAGNVTTCSFTVTVNCTTISGRIIWEHNDVSGIKDATVRLRKGTLQVSSVLSNANGNYTVVATSTGAHSITPVKNINRLNGVTAADATVILQHLNGAPLITDPYKKVAADVNRSGAISNQDANIITQALAGNASALAAFNVFWRFIPTTFVMPATSPNIVASFPESITLNVTGADVTGQDFFGVKLGDLNGSANPLAVPTTGPLVWTVRDEVLQAGKEYELQFAANGFSDLAAFQFGIDFDPSQLQLLSHSHTDAISMTSDNFGAGNAGLGEFRVVWSNVDGVTLTPGTNVFRLRFRALETGMKLSEVVKLDDSVLECLAFTETMAQGPVRLVFTTTTATDTPDSSTALKLQLMQNIPNPFVDVTTIGFILPDACEAVIRVTDVSGREITRYQRQYSAGYHEMEFRMENAAGYGVLFYELITPFGTQSKKMITGSR